MAELSNAPPSRSPRVPPAGLEVEGDAMSQADRAAAETLIRTTVQTVGNGATPQDFDELVRRNAGRVTREDIRAGRLGSAILGDIINSVEQARGSTPFNWSAATPQQIKAYMMAHGFDQAAFQRLMGTPGKGGETLNDGSLRNGTSSIGYGGIVANFGLDRSGNLSGFTHQLFDKQFKPLGYNEATARGVAGILGEREGLHGEALAKRIKEVAQDTKDGLGLDVNAYSKDVAAIGKKYSNPMIDHNKLLTEAERLKREGHTAEAEALVKKYNSGKRQLIDQATHENPDAVPHIGRLYRGMEQRRPTLAPELRSDTSDRGKYDKVAGSTAGMVPAVNPTNQGRTAAYQAAGLFDDAPPQREAAYTPSANEPKSPNPKSADAIKASTNLAEKDKDQKVVPEADAKGADHTKTASNVPAKPKPGISAPKII